MNRVLLLLPCLLLLGTGCASPVTNTLHPSHDELTFYPDGIVMETASNPGAKVSEDGIVTLLFEERGNEISGHNGLATADASSDWLSFTITDENADIGAFRAVQLPDGTYRTLMMDSTKGTRVGESVEGFLSESSDDGIAFTPDEGYRYLLQPEDNGSVGVYELFVNASDEVILLYIGDKQGDNTVRRAVSYDGGWTFEFDRFNVLGDQAFERHSDKYVD